eukprot:5688675-Ditylum_brightwellii.AAC.1
MMLDIIFSVTDQALCSLITRIEKMQVTEYVGKDISCITEFIHGAHVILSNCGFLSPNFMQILYDVFATATYETFVKHVSTAQTSSGLGLIPNLSVESFLDNVKRFYNFK